MSIKFIRLFALIFALLVVFSIVYNSVTTQNNIDQIFSKINTTKVPVDKETLLANANDLVYRYIDMPLDYLYGSCVIPLAVCGLITTGDILELGMGTFSTNVLHRIGM